MTAERLDAFWKGRVGAVDVGASPADGSRRLDRCLEFVAERGAQRRLVALFDGQLIDNGRKQILCVDVEELGERLGLGVEAVYPALSLGEGLAGDIERLAGAGVSGLRTQRRGF